MTPDGNAGSPSLHQAALEALDLPVLIHDHDTILYANHAAVTLLGVGDSEIVGRAITDFVHTDGRAAGAERRKLVMESGHEMNRLPIKLISLDGEPIYVTVDARPIEWSQGTAILVTGSVAASAK